MDCKKCGNPMCYPSQSKLCPECEGEALDKWIAEQEAAEHRVHLTAASGAADGDGNNGGGK